MHDRIRQAVIGLHLSAGIYLCVVVGLLWFATGPLSPNQHALIWTVIVLAGLVAGTIELIVIGLKRKHLWAWVAAVCVYALFLPSILFPLGVIGLWTLFHRGTRQAIGLVASPALGEPVRRRLKKARQQAAAR